jgi:Kef-type K+ transport system membrane component KefB
MRATRLAPAAAALLLVFSGEALAAGSTVAGQTFLWLAIILTLARLASLVERFGMPGVLGELLLGVLLGNLALLGVDFFAKVGEDPIIGVFAELGVVILLFQIGLETTLEDLRRVGLRALGVALIGPLLMPTASFNSHLFLAATLCATSVGITGRVFRDARRLDSPEARIVLGAAVIDDVLGLIILAVVSGFVASGTVSTMEVGKIVLEAFGFLAGAVIIGRAIAPHLSRILARLNPEMPMKLTLLLSVGLGLAWAAHHIGLAPIIGAFAAGVLLEPLFLKDFHAPPIVRDLEPFAKSLPAKEAEAFRAKLDHHAHRHHEQLLEPLGHFLVPVFFVYTGMQVRLETLADPQVLVIALGVTAVAIAGKVVAGLAAGSADRWIVGFGMVPRGEVGLIFAAIGKSLGVVNDTLYSVIVAMVILTTLVTPPVLGALLKRQARREAGNT